MVEKRKELKMLLSSHYPMRSSELSATGPRSLTDPCPWREQGEGWGKGCNAPITRQSDSGKLVQFTAIPLAKKEREGWGWGLTQITVIKPQRKVVSAHEVVCNVS